MAEASVLGLFREADGAAEASALLKASGFEDYEVMTGHPYPEGAFGERPPRHRLYVFPFIGAALGLTVAILLTAGTQVAYPVVTGGKPVLSIPPMAIISYEGTMLGAIIFTVLGIIFESRLPRPRLGLYDPKITEGYIGLLVSCPEEKVRSLEQLFRQAGAEDIKRSAKDQFGRR